MSKRLHSVFFIIFPEIACNFGEKYLNLHHIFKIGNGGFNMQMHTPAKLKNIFVKTLKRGTKI